MLSLTLLSTLRWLFRFMYALLLARLIINWISMNRYIDRHPLVKLVEKLSDPLVQPFRGLFQSRFDFSPVLTYFILSWIIEPLVFKVFGG
jgi:uncharacterized protein YggT (Ycf19 family)